MEGISGPGRAWGVALKGRAGHSDRPELQSQSVFPRPPPTRGSGGDRGRGCDTKGSGGRALCPVIHVAPQVENPAKTVFKKGGCKCPEEEKNLNTLVEFQKDLKMRFKNNNNKK